MAQQTINYSRQINRRTHVIYFSLLLSFAVIAGRVGYLQLYEHERFRKLAGQQQERVVSLAGKRGMITDRNGHKLAMDIQVFAIYVDPEYIRDNPKEMAAKLAPILEMKQEEVYKLLAGDYWRYLKRKVDEETVKKIRALKYPGIGVLTESKRVYPNNSLAASLIGFTDIDNEGIEGIEKSFNPYLKGGTNKVNILTDAYGNELLRADGNLPFLTEKTKANKVVLTIDENVQYIAERELAKGMEATKAARGLAIVMGLENGDLLALATNPTVNLNDIPGKGWDPRVKNWAVTDQFEPGSTMKIFTIAAALEAKKTTPTEVIQCPGRILINGVTPLHDHHQPPGRIRYLNPFQIMEVSSNVGSSILGRRMSDEEHRKLLYNFGFGHATRSGLKGEVNGDLPALPWRDVRQSTISFGHGVTVTPLQIVTATSAIANKGIRVEPRIIHEIYSPEGEIIKHFPPVKSRTLSEETAQQMLKMMEQVVESQGGTAHLAKIPGFVLGGKTGTADKPRTGQRGYGGDVISSFVGVLPADQPKYVIFVLFDSPQTAHYASLTAVPVYKEIVKNLITYYALQPSKPEELKSRIANH